MKFLSSPRIAPDFEWAVVGFWVMTAVFELGLKRRVPRILRTLFWLPGKVLRVCAVVIGLGFLLSGCANPDPLAVASGPLYPLNVGYWHPTPQDLSAPPPVTHY